MLVSCRGVPMSNGWGCASHWQRNVILRVSRLLCKWGTVPVSHYLLERMGLGLVAACSIPAEFNSYESSFVITL